MNGRFLKIALGVAMLVLVMLLVPGLRYAQDDNTEKSWDELAVDAVRAIKAGMLEQAYESCDAAMAAAGEPRPGDTRRSRALTLLGEIHNSAGKPQAALDAFKKGVELCEQSCGPMSPEMLEPLDALANFHFYRDELAEVEAIQARIVGISDLSRDQAERDQANRARNLAQVRWKLGKFDDAELGFQECLSAGQAAGAVFSSDLLHDMLLVAEFYRERENYQRAETIAEEALAMAESFEPLNAMDVVQCLDGLARIQLAAGTNLHGAGPAERALKLAEQERGEDHSDLTPHIALLAQISAKQGDEAKAETLWRRAIELTEKDLGPHCPELVALLEPYSVLLKESGKPAEAEEITNRIVNIREHEQEIVLGDGAACKTCGGTKSGDSAAEL
jgi:tetratricopeptide (TPR) repeat protein